ncbi:hypothetical protein RPE78_16115 (plasmid) [Thioclava litoralis]|uniref:Uncharacterized protein n=1 Tax=Thioclava litoralis TaxID=3076557 RepID=A0ABZ1E4Y0_9RHOB|nr:hypothetical protein RPE78_16115 [Thioclava sp. FTW29]
MHSESPDAHERYTRVRIRRTYENHGLWKELVRTERSETTSSEYEDMSKFFGYIIMIDTLFLLFPWIENSWPWLPVWE